ncbi:hypothetical protein BBJ28_00002679 [Nothophytophthora sp. Chile5]|nr:hypothetical protein BBJ28_00002679 [Nothophytophthora sp. Chile5]
MASKTQLDFILNPVRVAVARPTPLPLLPAASSLFVQPCCSSAASPTSTSPMSVAGWSGENAVLAALLRTPRASGLRRKRGPQQLPALTDSRNEKRRCLTVLPSLFSVSSPVVDSSVSVATSSEGESSDEEASLSTPRPSQSKKKTRLCKEPGCTSLAVSRRSCVRHGGGSRCTFEGCTNGAKLRNRCFQHGGSTVCLAAGCNSKAKRYGYCWSHGGGRICSTEGCVKVAAQGGSCWAHGGGNRCRLEGCSKRSYQKYGYHCKAHAAYNI